MALSLMLLAFVAQAATQPPVRARADLRALFSASDYPAEAAVNGEQGLVGFTVEVRPDGSVSACRTTRSSGAVSLDEGTCRVMMQARFTPARDAAGRAVADRFSSEISWVLPPDLPDAPPMRAQAQANLASYVNDSDYPPDAMRNNEHGTVSFQLVVTAQGRVRTCHIMASSGSRLLDFRTCQIMIVRARFAPARDAANHPVEDIVAGRIRWQLWGL